MAPKPIELHFGQHAISSLPIGARIVAFYSDGGGCWLGCKVSDDSFEDEADTAGTFTNEDGKKFCLSFHEQFVRLPDNFKLWCEVRGNNPLTLPTVGGRAE